MQPASTNASPSLVRPKVLRRPNQFSGSAPTTVDIPAEPTSDVVIAAFPLAQQPPAKTTSKTRAPATRAWQDDGRFAITLLAVVVIVNTALAMWLGTPTATPREIIVKQRLTTESTSPETSTSESPVNILGEDEPTGQVSH